MAKPAGTIFVELTLDDKVYKERLSGNLTSAQATAKGIETSWKVLGAKNDATYNAMRRSYENAMTLIKNSTTATANDILRAEEAKNAKLKSLNDRQFGAQVGMIDRLKANWIAAGAAFAAAMVTIHKGLAYMEEGAKALQIESSFKIMAESAGVNSERMIESMKKATRETIDDSDMMLKAVKLMTLGYNPEQIERFSNVVITASQIAGTTASEAYNELADAIGNRAPKALVRLGAVTREQMEIVNAAISAGADEVVLYELAMANLELKQKMLQGTQDEATIRMQELTAKTKDLTEAIGKGLIWVLEKAYHATEFYAGAMMGLVSAYARYRALVYTAIGDEKQAAENRWIADRAMETRNDLIGKWEKAVYGAGETEKRATKEELEGAKAKVDAQMDVLKVWAASKEAARKAEEEQRKSDAANKKFMEDYKRDVEGAFEFEKYKLEEQLKEFDKYVHDKVALYAWYQSEKRKIDIKEFAETANTREMGVWNEEGKLEQPEYVGEWGAESERVKAWKANQKALEEYGKSYEDQIKAMDAADKALSADNWWKTYVEDLEEAARANEIFKDSMDIMSQSFADAFAGFIVGTNTAKEAFQGMVQSIIAGMVRMATQSSSEQLMGLLFKTGSSLASAYFGGSQPTGMGTNTTFSGGGTIGSYSALVRHEGGPVDGTGAHRQVPAWMFASAPRLHDGLAADEFPAILQRGESVTKRGQSPSTNITINVAAPSGRMDRESLNQLQSGLYSTLQRAGKRNT